MSGDMAYILANPGWISKSPKPGASALRLVSKHMAITKKRKLIPACYPIGRTSKIIPESELILDLPRIPYCKISIDFA
jgi:hypothetical protein